MERGQERKKEGLRFLPQFSPVFDRVSCVFRLTILGSVVPSKKPCAFFSFAYTCFDLWRCWGLRLEKVWQHTQKCFSFFSFFRESV